VLAGALACSCGGSSKTPAKSCAQNSGMEGCACFANATCFPGLTCTTARLCVAPGDGGGGAGTGSAGKGGATGTGGTAGSGAGTTGVTGSGGAVTGSGGAGGTTGTGGMTAGTGGAGGNGGAGNTGTGGSGTGGSGTGGSGIGGAGTGGSGTGGSGTGGSGTGGSGTGGSGTGGTGTGGSGTGGSGTGGSGGCGNLIDNFEADTGYICKANGRQGYWFTYAGAMSTIYPAAAPAQPALLSTPRGSSRFAFHAFGDAVTFAGFGCYISNPPTATYDATGFTGVQFWIMGTATAFKYIVQIPATEATLYGGTCAATQCSGNSTVITGVQPTTWTLVSIPFSALTGGYAPFDITHIWSIEFQAIGGGDAGAEPFDFWIDDLSFY
jgi:hypothetical protein